MTEELKSLLEWIGGHWINSDDCGAAVKLEDLEDHISETYEIELEEITKITRVQ